ncbi:MAG: hypothetical protein WB789_03140 [Thermoplasmata archaeon]
METDEFEPVGDFTRVTIRWKYQRQEDRDKMSEPEMERAVTAMGENIDALIEKVLTESASAEA